jgi:hypothetical protein
VGWQLKFFGEGIVEFEGGITIMLLNACLFMMQAHPQWKSQRDGIIDTNSRFLAALVLSWIL